MFVATLKQRLEKSGGGQGRLRKVGYNHGERFALWFRSVGSTSPVASKRPRPGKAFAVSSRDQLTAAVLTINALFILTAYVAMRGLMATAMSTSLIARGDVEEGCMGYAERVLLSEQKQPEGDMDWQRLPNWKKGKPDASAI